MSSVRLGPNIFSLPTEVIEHVLVSSVVDGSAKAISQLAQTCRHFRHIIYQSPDQHLWREVFRTTFDDPRPAIAARNSGRAIANSREQSVAIGSSSPGNPHKDRQGSLSCSTELIKWEKDFTERQAATAYIQRNTCRSSLLSRSSPDPIPASSSKRKSRSQSPRLHDDTDLLRTLRAVLDTLLKALPLPSTVTLSYPSNKPPRNFPPRTSNIILSDSNVTAQTSSDQLIEDAVPSVIHTVTQWRSSNISWAEKVLKSHGYPLRLMEKLIMKSDRGFDAEFDQSEVGRLFYRLVCCTGFIPVRLSEGDAVAKRINRRAGDGTPTDSESEGEGTTTPQGLADRSIAGQEILARRRARLRVYDMRYLARERHWGPYLPVRSGSSKSSRRRDDDEPLERRIAMIFGVHPNDLTVEVAETEDSTDDDEDGDGDDGAEYQPEAEDMESDEEEDFLLPLIPPTPAPDPAAAPSPPRPLPQPHLLLPDWSYLAAVRQVVEANLSEVATEEMLEGLRDLGGVRIGSAPRNFGSVYRDGAVDAGTSNGVGGEGEGWDWAGVAGAWRRCVCWMDYRDLIIGLLTLNLLQPQIHSPSSRFSDSELAEAMRIIPMTLRITSYGPAHPEWPGRPTIHVEGQAEGPEHTARKVWGTVGMIGDGNIRWNLIHCRLDGTQWEDEWVMEGVQIGGVGSAMGILGMWTGANHERTDPLGPSWMWKVRP
ncbi:hypothetical protein JAAARDRAFT_57963 [Jaapia argillacea MUCL 33604]|uniref:F-box domain-containing protein n=1 Tax=Jaapia argillacea MUCL 33604 TaxID=933084 RepID=A0A067PTT9_9AGAM|nr:hypothetical protein JAAARDRAFT_57963 [Jaapia argillacea MUCL 33604]